MALAPHSYLRSPLLLAAAEGGQKKDLTVFADRLKHTAGAHLAVDRHGDRRFDVAVLEQLFAKPRELAIEVFDQTSDVAAAGRYTVLAAG